MKRGERWLSLAIFFSFFAKSFKGRCDSHESHLPLFGTIYFPTAPFLLYRKLLCGRRRREFRKRNYFVKNTQKIDEKIVHIIQYKHNLCRNQAVYAKNRTTGKSMLRFLPEQKNLPIRLTGSGAVNSGAGR